MTTFKVGDRVAVNDGNTVMTVTAVHPDYTVTARWSYPNYLNPITRKPQTFWAVFDTQFVRKVN